MIKFPTPNFSGGLIQYNNRYIPCSCITNIEANEKSDSKTNVTIINQRDEFYKTPMAFEVLDGTPARWAKAYCSAERSNGIFDVLA